MRSKSEHDESRDGTTHNLEFDLLSEVLRTPDTTQRNLASRLGISLGLTNLLLRNVARKGYVRVARAKWRRRLYALTPKGIVQKVLLTVTYVGRFLDHYQKVRLILREELELVALHAESRVAIYGTGDFAELVYLGIKEFGIEEVDVFGPKGVAGSRFLGILVQDATTLKPEHYDRVVVAELKGTRKISSEILALGVAPDHLLTFFDNMPRESMEQIVANTQTDPEER